MPLAPGKSKNAPVGLYLMILSHFTAGIDTNGKIKNKNKNILEIFLHKLTLIALRFEHNLECIKNFDHNLYLPTIC